MPGMPGGDLVGASSVAQLDESLAAADLELTAQQRASWTRRGDRGGGHPQDSAIADMRKWQFCRFICRG